MVTASHVQGEEEAMEPSANWERIPSNLSPVLSVWKRYKDQLDSLLCLLFSLPSSHTEETFDNHIKSSHLPVSSTHLSLLPSTPHFSFTLKHCHLHLSSILFSCHRQTSPSAAPEDNSLQLSSSAASSLACQLSSLGSFADHRLHPTCILFPCAWQFSLSRCT